MANTVILADGTHRAKVWQIGCFALNNTAINLYYMMMLYMSYYAAGILGFGVALVSGLLTGLNILDGITDPIIGFIIDKTNSRFGKFRTFMVLGNAILAVDMLLLYLCQFAGAFKLPMLIVCFVLYDIGYTFQFDITRAAQTVLTNDPKQRPLFSAFDMVLNIILYVGFSMLVSNYLITKHGDFTAPMFAEFFILVVIASAVCTALAVLGIRAKDRPEFYGTDEKSPKVKLSDCFGILRSNKNVLMLILSAATDKLFSNITTNATVTVMLFAIICGNFELSGHFNMFVFAPSMIISLLCIWFAQRRGQKKALLLATYGAIVANLIVFFLFVLGDPKTLSFSNWGYFTIVLLAGMAFRGGFMSVGNSIIIPMIGDCADYEVYRSGKYMPGMIGGVFSFADKIVTSLNSLVVGALVIAIGFRETFPSVTTPYSGAVFWITMLCFCGLPLLGWIVNILALRKYDLTPEKMAEIRAANESKKVDVVQA